MGEKPVETELWMLALAVVAYLTLRLALRSMFPPAAG
jgi:hypothetical protein